MKIFKIILFVIATYCAPQFPFCQAPSQVQVKFADGKIYQAKELGRTATTIKVEFLHSHSIYVFNNSGFITHSTGSYGVGARVNYIRVYKYVQDVYERDIMRATGAPELNVGIEFEDGQVYFGWVAETDVAGIFTLKFYHTHSTYSMRKVNGIWEVAWTDIGTYAVGTMLHQLYEVAEKSGEENYFSAE